jgi:endoglucanase
MARGINLGNMLEAPVEGDWGPVFDPAWPPLIKAAGFSTVRLPVRFSNHASVDASALLDPTFLARVDYVLAQLKAAGLNVVIDMHHYRQLDGDGLDSGEIAVDPSVVQARAIAIWTQLGSHFASQPASVMFELYNEPHNIQDTGASAPWNALYPKLLAAVRKTNPTRAVLIGPAFWNNASALPDFTPPTDSNVIVTIHNYLPTVFTLQGQWGQPQPINTPWNGDATAFTGALDTAKAWSVAQGKPIFVGEFGSNLAAPLASRVAWTTMARTQIEARGFQWAVWNFDSDFGLYDTSAKAWNTALLKTLFP